MSIAQPPRAAILPPKWRLRFAQVTTLALVLYPILLAWFTAPSRFLNDSSYEAKLDGISSQAVPLELPKDEKDLDHTLRVEDFKRTEVELNPKLPEEASRRHEAQLKLYRRALAWDYVFIEIYVSQFVAMALLVATTGPLLLIQRLAIGSIVIAGVFDWLENFRIRDILALGKRPFGDLIARVTLVSSVKWIAIFVASLLLAPILWRLSGTGRWFRITIVAALIAASVTGFVGVLPECHSFLSLALAIYSVVPVFILWRFAISPKVEAIDSDLRARAEDRAGAEIKARMNQRREAPFDIGLRSTAPKWSLDKLENASPPASDSRSTPTGGENA